MSNSWFHIEQGQGRPLVLIHGIGMSHRAWQPVMDLLARERRVIAVDVAGFGQTPTINGPVSEQALVAGLQQTLADLGINEPVDIAGNSMGGWLALAAATQGLARSVVAISPAGLADISEAPRHIRPTFDAARLMAQRFPRIAERLIRFGVARSAFLAVPMSIRGYKIPASAAVRSLQDFAQAPGFEATYDIIDRVEGLSDLSIPLTIAFGRLDFLLTRSMQNRRWLPAQTVWLKPWSWGHVPMWDDPEGVANVILTGTQ